jgi:4-hydroxy-3-methylbut-2-enyl diphosphate reductase
MKTFNVPITYRSPLISAIKNRRKQEDRLKKDFTPTRLDLGELQIYLARHFGFCYGVENAIEISFRTIDENPDKRIFLLSEMIHNPQVNNDLRSKGLKFLQDTSGKQIISFSDLHADDIVIIPAFGTTLEIEKKLNDIGIRTEKYNTTCPFVERVWNKSEQIAAKGYTVVIHGKPNHEETRATFSHAASNTPSIVIKDMAEAMELAKFITGEAGIAKFDEVFRGRLSEGFDPDRDLQRIGVVNQTTMLASETEAIADFLKSVMIGKFKLKEKGIAERFAETRDTLCYATNDNQTSVSNLLETPADLAIVVGGYNSSNTSHLVELCEEKLPTFYIDSEKKIISKDEILHYNFHSHQELLTKGFLGKHNPLRVLVTSGASCPDAVVESVLRRLASFYGKEAEFELLSGQFS